LGALVLNQQRRNIIREFSTLDASTFPPTDATPPSNRGLPDSPTTRLPNEPWTAAMLQQLRAPGIRNKPEADDIDVECQ
jgi:hypothetical protein